MNKYVRRSREGIFISAIIEPKKTTTQVGQTSDSIAY